MHIISRLNFNFIPLIDSFSSDNLTVIQLQRCLYIVTKYKPTDSIEKTFLQLPLIISTSNLKLL